MWKGEYCKLWYFTNAGFKTAEKHASSQGAFDYIAVRREDEDSKVLVVAAAAEFPALKSYERSGSSKLVPGEDLSWKDFLEAVPQIVISTRDNDWSDD